MPNLFNCTEPGIKKDSKTAEVTVMHAHKNTGFDAEVYHGRMDSYMTAADALATRKHYAKLSRCHTFFKAYSESETDPELKARAATAAYDDAQKIKDIRRYQNVAVGASGCTLS